MTSAKNVLMAQDGPVTTVTMNRPERRNAFNPAMIEELTDAFLLLGRDPGVRVVALEGAGTAFSAGADLEYMKSVASFGAEENIADAKRLFDLFTTIATCPKPVVVKVQGAAIGGGAGLVAAADISVAEQNARFAFTEVRLGLVPAVVSPFVVARIGTTAARELFLTGETISASRARSIGLVGHVVASEELDAKLAERTAALLGSGPDAVATVKRLIPFVWQRREGAREDLAEMIAGLRSSPEGKEGMAAFLERRTPSWSRANEEERDG